MSKSKRREAWRRVAQVFAAPAIAAGLWGLPVPSSAQTVRAVEGNQISGTCPARSCAAVAIARPGNASLPAQQLLRNGAQAAGRATLTRPAGGNAFTLSYNAATQTLTYTVANGSTQTASGTDLAGANFLSLLARGTATAPARLTGLTFNGTALETLETGLGTLASAGTFEYLTVANFSGASWTLTGRFVIPAGSGESPRAELSLSVAGRSNQLSAAGETLHIFGPPLTTNAGALAGNVNVLSTLIFNQTADGTFAGQVRGPGTVEKRGTSALTLSSNSAAFTGTTRVEAGGLNLTGTLGGSLIVGPDGRLTGTGSAGAATIAGAVSAGQIGTVGTLTTASLALQPGGTVVVDIQGGNADLVRTTGAAQLGSAALTILTPGNALPAGGPFVIIDAAGGVSGTFGAVSGPRTLDLALLPVYEPGRVLLALAAAAPESQSPKDIYPTADGVLFDTGRVFLHTLDDRTLAFGPGAVALGPTLAASGPPQPQVWGVAFGRRTNVGDGTAEATADLIGLGAGIAWALSPAWADRGRLGFALGVTDGRVALGSGGGEADLRLLHLGAFAMAERGPWQFAGGVAIGGGEIDYRRTVDAALDLTALGSADTTRTEAFVEVGYRLPPPAAVPSITLMPFLRGEVVHVVRDRLTETGAGSLNLDVAAVDSTRGFLQAGIEARHEGSLDGRPLSLRASVAWEHLLGDTVPVAASTLTPFGVDFTTEGAPLARDRLVLDLGAAWQISQGATAHAALRATFGDGIEEAQLSLGAAWRF